MSSLWTVEAKLPPGFRFHPRDDELICDYLMKRVTGSYCQDHQYSPLLIQVDLNNCEPWDIPETACVGGKERYFYSQRDRKYESGLRRNRATVSGYWKATGRDRPIFRREIHVGARKTLVFYQGRAPKGSRTDWVMHEFRLEQTLNPGPDIPSPAKEDWVLCRVFNKKYRSEEAAGELQEAGSCYGAIASASDPSLKPVIEPCSIAFDQTDFDQCLEQVPCFSNFTSSQTSPTSSLTARMNSQETSSLLAGDTVPYFGGANIAETGAYSSALLSNHPSVCDESSFKAVLVHYKSRLMKDFPSLGDLGS